MAMKPVVVVGVVVAVAVGAYFTYTLLGNTDTKITLAMSDGQCKLTKEAEIRVKNKKKVTWKIDNQCDAAQTVTLGNFRLPPITITTDCNPEGSDFPFQESDKGLPQRQKTVNGHASGSIKLRSARNNSGAAVTYYYDVCLGNLKVDPRLIVDP